MKSNRIIIFPKDIQRVTGRSERYGRILIRKMKTHYQKQNHQYISIDEFCQYTGLDKAAVIANLIQS